MAGVQRLTLAFRSACGCSGTVVGAGCAPIAPVTAVTPVTAIAVTRAALALFLRFRRACFGTLRVAVELQVGQRCNQCSGVARLAGQWG